MPVKPSQLQKALQIVLSAGVAIGVIFAGCFYGRELLALLKTVNPFWLFAGLTSYAVNYLLRAIRLFFLSSKRVPLWPEGLHATCLHGFATYMLPFRSGELTLPITLKATTDLNLTLSSQILIRARLLDIQVLGLITTLSALFADVMISQMMKVVWLAMGLVMLFTPMMIHYIANFSRKSSIRWLQRLSRFGVRDQFRISEYIISLAIWIAVAGCFYFAAHAIGLPLNPIQVWLLVTLQLPLQLVPLQGFANAGNHEGGWIAGLVLLGVPASTAFEISLATHTILLAYVLVLGPAALITGRFINRRTNIKA